MKEKSKDPCPFCGSDDVRLAGMNYPWFPVYEYWRACCFKCGANSQVFSQDNRPDASRRAAIKAWNKRSLTPQKEKRNE